MPSRRTSDAWRSGVPTYSAREGWAGYAPAGDDAPEYDERALQAYMAALTIDGHPLDAAEAAALRSANRSVDATRNVLLRGRGNVSTDIEASGGNSTVRTETARRTARHLARQHAVPSDGPGCGPFRRREPPDAALTYSAGALAAGAGNCGEHASVAALMHAPHLGPDDEVRIVEHGTMDHRWAEVHAAGSSSSPIVLDPWANGPAMYHEDTRFASDRSQVFDVRTFRHDDGVEAGDTVSGWLQDPGLPGWVADAERRVGPDFRYADSRIYEPYSVASDEFAGRVRERMVTPVEDSLYADSGQEPDLVECARRRRLLNEVAAAGAARHTGRGVASASSEAPDILSAAHWLDR
ncbi:hypothetical protein L0947_08345 [Paracidovorax citrulli]|uniref:hypothetical protein n=1 Tax=Paracidovorax citrulli TaxID=80869 RepID=UPI00110FC336|nr:hypothetical protein [Paracidovorax citrulli]QCX09460.1 hypothetical protein APS58_0506 [Paracidovorax citrulli]UEG47561.1 hypothetical protein LKW27_06755 [Paracidovorax citrulli]UMT96097.1 hypothetical protein FRC97_14430 [Paracidovorax citrulli]